MWLGPPAPKVLGAKHISNLDVVLFGFTVMWLDIVFIFIFGLAFHEEPSVAKFCAKGVALGKHATFEHALSFFFAAEVAPNPVVVL